MFCLSSTSPERYDNHWVYSSATLVDCQTARVWMVANTTLGAHCNLVDGQKFGPPPKPEKLLPLIEILNTPHQGRTPKLGGLVEKIFDTQEHLVCYRIRIIYLCFEISNNH